MNQTPENQNLTDLKLLEEIASGDREAFKVMYERYVRQIFVLLPIKN